MMKQCTQSACRRIFNAKANKGVCPHCNHAYRGFTLKSKPFSYVRKIGGRFYDLAPVFAPELVERRILQIKVLRTIVPDLSLLEARNLLFDMLEIPIPDASKHGKRP